MPPRRPDRDWRSARRARGRRGAAPVRRPGPAVAAARRTGAGNAAAPARRAPPRRAPLAPVSASPVAATPGSRAQRRHRPRPAPSRAGCRGPARPSRSVPQRWPVPGCGSRVRRARGDRRQPPGCRAGSGPRWRARACSCPIRTAPRPASCGPRAARTTRHPGQADQSLDGRSRGCAPRATQVDGQGSSVRESFEHAGALERPMQGDGSTGHDDDRRDRHEDEPDDLDERVDVRRSTGPSRGSRRRRHWRPRRWPGPGTSRSGTA